jgi:ABC-2 type transport system permease protein
MGAFLQLLRTDLVLYFSNRRAVMMSIAAPILIATFFGYLFGNKGDGPSRIPVAVVDLDQSALSKKLITAFQGEKLFDIQLASESDGIALAKAGTVRAAVVIPPGFGAQAGTALFTARDKPELVLHYDPSQSAALQAVRGVLAQHVMQTVSADAFSSTSNTLPDMRKAIAASSTLAPERREELTNMFESIERVQHRADADNNADTTAGAATSARPSLGLPYTIKEVEASSGPDIPYNSYAHSFAGMSVQFILMMGVDVGIALLAMRRLGLWRRLRAAPLSKSTLLGSRIASCAITALILLTVIYAFAMLVFKVRIEGSMVGFIGVSVAFALMTASFGLLIASLGKTPEATRGLAIVATLLLVMLGGAWVPSFVFPEWMQQLTQYVPTRWAVDGLDAMTWRAQPLAAAFKPVALMLGAAAVFGAIAIKAFAWEE